MLAADPGLTRLRIATRGALSIALALFGEWLFVGGTGALEVATPLRAMPSQVAAAGAQHHEMLVVAMLLGGLVAMLCGMNANETTATGQAVTIVFIGVSVAAALALGLWVGPHRDAALVLMVVVLVIGAYGRRFGQRGAVTGVIFFIGYFFGFFLSSALHEAAAAWLAAEIGVAAAAALAVRALLFRPSAATDLRLTLKTYESRLRRVLDVAAALVDERSDRRRRELEQRMLRLDEAALIVEGQMERRGALGPDAADALGEWVFDTEVAASNVARFSDLLSSTELDPARCRAVRRTLDALRAREYDAARAAAKALIATNGATQRQNGSMHQQDEQQDEQHDEEEARRWVLRRRLSRAAVDLADALEQDTASVSRDLVRRARPSGEPGGFTPAVSLRGGWLPGSADVSTEASLLPSRRVALAPYLRTSAQMAIAVSVAIAAGDALDAGRFYWAVVAALLALIGTNTVAEQLRKAAFRIVGTLAGVVAGTALVDLVGHHSIWSLVVVVGAMWIGMYFFRVNYAVMAMAVTVSLSQAYLSLGEFSNGLLWERLAETSVGAAAAMVTVLLVLPLRTRQVVDVALAGVVEAATCLATSAVELISGSSADEDLRPAARGVDAAFQALIATAGPLRLAAWSDSRDTLTHQLASATAARNAARNLSADAQVPAYRVDGDCRSELRTAIGVFQESAAALAAHLRGGAGSGPGPATGSSYRRAASWFSGAEEGTTQEDPRAPSRPTRNLALRDLVLLDDAFAGLALASGMHAVRTMPHAVASPAQPAG